MDDKHSQDPWAQRIDSIGSTFIVLALTVTACLLVLHWAGVL